MKFSVASYNVLADAYVRPERYPGIPPALLDLRHRQPALLDRVASLAADVICLQEVEPAVFQVLAEKLGSLGYQGHFARKDRGKPDGCATFVRDSVFAVQTEHLLYFTDGQGILPPSGHVALILVLERESWQVVVANTHLKWDPPGTPRERQLGYRQITQLLSERNTLGLQGRPWVLGGDFNVTPESKIIRAVEEAGFVDAFQDREGGWTFFREGEGKRIDYLFYTPDLTARPRELGDADRAIPLPSLEEPSDHRPIVVEFEGRQEPRMEHGSTTE